MMNKVKEALERLELRSDISPNDPHIKTLVDLAESVLSVAGRMPEKGDLYMQHDIDTPLGQEGLINKGRNDAIDQCTLAFAWQELSRDEIKKIIENNTHNLYGPSGEAFLCTALNLGIEELADAIIKKIKVE